jgi:glycosyltransferase involved in cell wall biosynthesis
VKCICILVQNYYDFDVRVRRKAEALITAGYQVDVIALRAARDTRRSYQLNGVNVYTVRLSKHRGSLLRYALEYAVFFGFSAWKVFRLMQRRRYVIVDVNNLPDFLVFAALWAKLRGAKVVLDMHEITPEFYQSKYGVGKKAWLIRALRLVERLSVSFADHVITINKPVGLLLQSRGLRPELTTIVMNSVDESLFSGTFPAPRSVPFPKASYVMMYHGTLTKIYGLDIAIEAFAKSHERMPGAEFWILGHGPQMEELRELATRLGLGPRVKLFGNVRPEEIPAWLAYADVGVLPTRRDSFLDLSFSNKLSEYVFMAKAVICSNLRSICSYFSENALGYFDANHIDDLAKQMIRLYENPDLRASLAAQAAVEYRPIRWEVMRGRYLDLVAALTTPNPAPAPRFDFGKA